jgi:F-type H+-transporting ATPase subunit b
MTMRTWVNGLVAAGLASLAMGGPAAAAGMPQLNFNDYAPQLVWLAIVFLVLYWVMSRLAVPAIASTLKGRQAKIQSDLDAAGRANDDTRTLVETYQKRLADARENARRVIREQAEADAAAAAARSHELAERLAAQVAEAERRIADQRRVVMTSFEALAEEIAQNVYNKVAGQPADAGALNARVAAAAKGSRL